MSGHPENLMFSITLNNTSADLFISRLLLESSPPNYLIKKLQKSYDNHDSLENYFYNNPFQWVDILELAQF